MLRMMIGRIWALLFAICLKVSLFFGISFKVGRVWELLSSICPNLLLFFANSFNVDF